MLKYGLMKSDFLLSLVSKNSQKINTMLIFPMVDKFFLEKSILKYCPINSDVAISDLDFKKVDFSYYYEIVMSDIFKKNKIDFSVKYVVTIDINSCGLVCDVTGVRYDVIFLGKKPILYFIYIDINEILNFNRTEL